METANESIDSCIEEFQGMLEPLEESYEARVSRSREIISGFEEVLTKTAEIMKDTGKKVSDQADFKTGDATIKVTKNLPVKIKNDKYYGYGIGWARNRLFEVIGQDKRIQPEYFTEKRDVEVEVSLLEHVRQIQEGYTMGKNNLDAQLLIARTEVNNYSKTIKEMFSLERKAVKKLEETTLKKVELEKRIEDAQRKYESFLQESSEDKEMDLELQQERRNLSEEYSTILGKESTLKKGSISLGNFRKAYELMMDNIDYMIRLGNQASEAMEQELGYLRSTSTANIAVAGLTQGLIRALNSRDEASRSANQFLLTIGLFANMANHAMKTLDTPFIDSSAIEKSALMLEKAKESYRQGNLIAYEN